VTSTTLTSAGRVAEDKQGSSMIGSATITSAPEPGRENTCGYSVTQHAEDHAEKPENRNEIDGIARSG
jgi:hypothetical protein